MGAQHTSGPWCVEDPMDFELTIVEAGKETHEWRFIASCSLPDGDDDQDFTSGEVQANARLIASAPDLLEALQRIADAPAWGAPDRWETTPDEVRQLARKAISLATGESK